MIGAVAGLGVLPIDRELFETVIREGMPAARVEANLRAFAIGTAAVPETRLILGSAGIHKARRNGAMKSPYKAVKVTDDVWWVGAIDWNIRDFHGYRTPRGSTYNAYLIMADKITLIDTVKAPFREEMMARIADVVDPGRIDYIVSNHSEMDHSGCLPEVIEAVRPEKVIASAVGAKTLRELFPLEDGNHRRQGWGDPQPRQPDPHLHGDPDAPLARQHVRLPQRREAPLLPGRLRDALRLPGAVRRPDRPGDPGLRGGDLLREHHPPLLAAGPEAPGEGDRRRASHSR